MAIHRETHATQVREGLPSRQLDLWGDWTPAPPATEQAALPRARGVNDPDLEWLLCVMPALMGEGSGHGALVAALERGQALGGGCASSAGAEDAVERARPHVQRSRRLMAIWARVALQHRLVLQAHYYQPRSHWRPGVQAQLGELASTCKHLTPMWDSLEVACSNASTSGHAARIKRELGRAARALSAAHRAWRDAKAEAASSWAQG